MSAGAQIDYSALLGSQIGADPDAVSHFQQLPPLEKQKVLLRVNPGYAALPPQEQAKALNVIQYGPNGTQFEQERQPQNQEGFLAHSGDVIGNQLKGIGSIFTQPWQDAASVYRGARASGQGVLRSGAEALATAAFDPEARQAISSAQMEANEEQQGRNFFYRQFLAPAAAGVGVNVPGMEHQADIGNRSGVLSEAAVPATEAALGSAFAFAKGAKPTEAPPTEAAPPTSPEPSATAGIAEQKGPALTGGFAEKLGIADPPPKSLMTRAVKPLASNSGWDAAIAKAMPDMKAAESDLGRPIQGVDDALSAVNVAKKKLWAQYQQKLSQASGARPDANTIAESPESMVSEAPFSGAGGATIDGNQIADAMVSSIDKRTALQNPSLVKQIQGIADTYRRPLSLNEAEDFLQSANNDLASYYAKNKVGQQVAARDPSTGYVVAEANALRDGLYNKLDDLTGSGARDFKKRYGALTNVESELLRRKNVAARQQPVSLAEQIAMSGGVGDILRPDRLLTRAQNVAIARWLKNYGSADSMIARAFAKLGGAPDTTPPVSAKPSIIPGAAAVAASNPGFRSNSDLFDEGLQLYRQAHPRL